MKKAGIGAKICFVVAATFNCFFILLSGALIASSSHFVQESSFEVAGATLMQKDWLKMPIVQVSVREACQPTEEVLFGMDWAGMTEGCVHYNKMGSNWVDWKTSTSSLVGSNNG